MMAEIVGQSRPRIAFSHWTKNLQRRAAIEASEMARTIGKKYQSLKVPRTMMLAIG
jgi:hypothetical protein